MQAVLFDLDNTLLPTYASRREIFFDALRQSNPHLSREELDANWTLSFEQVVHACAPRVDYDEFLMSYERRLRANPVAPLACAQPLLEALSKAGIPCLVFTATSRPLAVADLETSGLLMHISEVLAAEDFVHPKPDIRAADELVAHLRRQSLDPRRSSLVGDSVSDAELAQAAGMQFFAVTTGRHERAAFLSIGLADHHIATDLCDLAERCFAPLTASMS